MNKSRQLSAIMFTDIEGYTALMQNDEQEALKIRTKHRDVFEANTKKHNGEIVQYFGDGTLSIFKSSVEAVKCAINMQKAYLKKPIVNVRIGIHVGDILYSKHDIVGDAVNVAARIESCAVPGSVLISDDVKKQIQSHEDINTTYLHNFQFKNVENALPIYAVSNPPLVLPDVEELKRKFKTKEEIVYTPRKKTTTLKNSIIVMVILLLVYAILKYVAFQKEPEELSIAIIPFEMLSDDESTKLISLGLTDNIIEKLSTVQDLHVIAKQSLNYFSGMNKPIVEIAEDLHVNYVLQATVKKSDSTTVFVAVQLFNTKKKKFIWSEEFVENVSEVHKIEQEILNEIIDKLDISVTETNQNLFDAKSYSNEKAYVMYLKGKLHLMEQDSAYQIKSSNYFKQSILEDSTYAEPYIALAKMNWNTFIKSLDSLDTSLRDNTLTYLEKAEALDSTNPVILNLRGQMFMFHDDYNMAEKSFEKALALSPNNLESRKGYAQALGLRGDFSGQLEQAAIAYELDPMTYDTTSLYLNALTNNEQFVAAENLLNKIKQYQSQQIDSLSILKLNTRLYLSQPDFNKAIPPLEKIVQSDQMYFRLLGYSYGKVGNLVNAYKIIDSIKQLNASSIKNYHIATVFAGLDEVDSVMYYLDTARNKQSRMLQQDRKMLFQQFENEPKFKAILSQHKLDYSKE